jgi:hypothetical protein
VNLISLDLIWIDGEVLLTGPSGNGRRKLKRFE